MLAVPLQCLRVYGRLKEMQFMARVQITVMLEYTTAPNSFQVKLDGTFGKKVGYNTQTNCR
jgi:hypothetical protein